MFHTAGEVQRRLREALLEVELDQRPSIFSHFGPRLSLSSVSEVAPSREVVFQLEILSIRDATDEEIEVGGKVNADPDISEVLGKLH